MNRRLLLWAPLGLLGCSSPKPTPAAAPPRPSAPAGPPLEFSFESLDERPVSSEALRGRASLLVFLATYGNDSLLQARHARKVFLEHTPRINAAAVFLEPIENRLLVRVFRDSAQLPFPSAMGDADTIAGKGPFEGIGAVPTALVLDHEGREVWRKLGGAQSDELRRVLRDAQRGVWERP
ncbi:MAG: TlpA family protein disulfide reductase [Polyangiaceae bacterium]|nr:TlpA family protein disulfide reductase [Polyangiaceae bacterium]